MKKMNLEDYKIECFIGGFSANNFWLRSDGNRLLYINPVVPFQYWQEAEIIEPDPETLSRFIQSIKGLGRWRRKYEINVLDGHDWEFLIKGPDVNLKASGCSAYPDNFDDAIKAIVKLIGGREFCGRGGLTGS